jgi:hypothetical protein
VSEQTPTKVDRTGGISVVNQDSLAPNEEIDDSALGNKPSTAPGEGPGLDEAGDQANASGWLPADAPPDWPSAEAHQRIVRRRQELYEAMQRLETSVARASGLHGWAENVGEALDFLQAALERHVNEVEAADGLFADVIERAPRLASDVETLRKEHEELLASCRSAKDLVAQVTEIRQQVLGILGHLAVHRQRGSELLFDTYNLDLGSGG